MGGFGGGVCQGLGYEREASFATKYFNVSVTELRVRGYHYVGQKIGEKYWLGDQVAAASVGLTKDLLETKENGEAIGHFANLNNLADNPQP